MGFEFDDRSFLRKLLFFFGMHIVTALLNLIILGFLSKKKN